MKKIAIPITEEGILDGHFGHCKYFALITVEDNTITSEERLVPPPHEPGVLPRWLADKGATDIIAGGMGQRAIQLFNQYKVNAFVGAPPEDVNYLVNAFVNNTLSLSANYCDH